MLVKILEILSELYAESIVLLILLYNSTCLVQASSRWQYSNPGLSEKIRALCHCATLIAPSTFYPQGHSIFYNLVRTSIEFMTILKLNGRANHWANIVESTDGKETLEIWEHEVTFKGLIYNGIVSISLWYCIVTIPNF